MRIFAAFYLVFSFMFSSHLSANDLEKQEESSDGYTINYDTIAIGEYIRFASKISGINFLFNPEDLDFTVTVVSDAPITPQNVMATLLQTLRIHGLELLEQDGNLTIHKSAGVQQIAKLVTESGQEKNAPIVTRIFRVNYLKPDSIAAIIRPMISAASILEVSTETRQIILTDITANVNKVASLIEILDSPYNPLEVKIYHPIHNSPQSLVNLCTQIMLPIAHGNPFTLVVQTMANSIFIVSTPELVEQALSALKSLDVPPSEHVIRERKLSGDNIYVYRGEHRSAEDLLMGLHNIETNLRATGLTEGDLLDTIESGRAVSGTNSLVFIGSKDSIVKLKEFLEALDLPGKDGVLKSSFFIYKPVNRSAAEIDKALKEMGKNLRESEGVDPALLETIFSAKINQSTNTLVFSGKENQFAPLRELLATIDLPGGKKVVSQKKSFFLYKLEHSTYDELQKSLKNFAKSLNQTNVDDEGVIASIEDMQYIPETQSVLFSGTDTALDRLKEIAPKFDAGISNLPVSNEFYIYKPKAQRGDQLTHSIKELAADLKTETFADQAFVRTLESIKFVKATNSLLFTGDKASLARLETLLGTLDVPSTEKVADKNFYLYTPPDNSKEQLDLYLSQVAGNLDRKNEAYLIDTIRSAKWIEASRSYLFQGTDTSVTRLKELLATFEKNRGPTSEKTFFLYQLQYVSEPKANQYFEQLGVNLEKQGSASSSLIETIKTRQWISDSNSFLFSGNEKDFVQLRDLIKSFDNTETAANKPGYFIYKLQNTTTNVIEEDLDKLAKNLESTGEGGSKIYKAIEQLRFVKETNSIILSGDPAVIEELKQIIADYDKEGASKGPVSSDFYMYKPQNLPAAEIEKSLKDVGNSLQQADLADPSLLKAINSAKYVATTNSLIFTGSPEALQKIQSLLKEIDVTAKSHAPIQHVGKTTFLLYKLKNATGPQIVDSIKNVEADLKRHGGGDKDFLTALSTVKYVKETNSLLFTGTEAALGKVESLVVTFDVLSPTATTDKPAMPTGATNFYLYRPSVVPGLDLEKLMQDFADNLRMSGLSDPELFNAILSMRWVEKTQSLIFTGTPKALDQIKVLLKEFDVQSNLSDHVTADNALQSIDNTNFLVYKLQYHRGDEIQGALRQIAKDLTNTNAPINHSLLSAIQSIQWLDVTNSLLCSGDHDTLIRLKELIKNLDIPLKQVFIEVLVIETSLTNALNFGLEWGTNYNFNDKFGVSSYNTTPPVNSSSTFPDSFITNLAKLTPPANPTPIGNIPPNAGFDLGVIGEVIKHNGKTFLTLGSLLTALQSDTETTIVNTPKILAQDGRTSTFFSGSNIPFTGSFVNNTQSGATIQTSNLEYRDIGLKLTITPVLGNSNIVTLDINLDREQTATDITQSQISFSSQTANGIVTSKTMMQTTVHVPDRNFLVLSGFVNNSNTKQKAGIPCLGGLPLIGAAFSQSNDTISTQNIVIFLRPYILNSVDDMRRVTAEQEEYFRDQSSTPFLEHNFEESIELIKTIDDE